MLIVLQSLANMNSSSVVFILCAFAVSSAFAGQNFLEMVATDLMDCAKQLNVNRASIIQIYASGNKLANDPDFKCFGACMLKAKGVMDSFGRIDKSKVPTMVPPNAAHADEIIAALNGCLDQTGANECDTANKVFDCMVQKVAQTMQ